MATTEIQWTHRPGTIGSTWNPIRARRRDTGKVGWHCEKVSPACKNCYAELFNSRNLPNGGTGLPYTVQSREKVEIFVDRLDEPLRWRKPRTVFVCSMTDLFAEFVPFEMIDRVFAVMALTPQHTYLILTKRPERMAEYLADRREAIETERDFTALEPPCDNAQWIPPQVGPEGREELAGYWDGCQGTMPWPLHNVELGCSIENQATADARIPHLLRCPATVRFVSYEPMLAAVDFTTIAMDAHIEYGDGSPSKPMVFNSLMVMPDSPGCRWGEGGIHWVICGVESRGSRVGRCPDDFHAIVRRTINQCRAAGVAAFVKQIPGVGGRVLHDLDDFPPDMRVREFPKGTNP